MLGQTCFWSIFQAYFRDSFCSDRCLVNSRRLISVCCVALIPLICVNVSFGVLSVLNIRSALLTGKNIGEKSLLRATADGGVINSVNHPRKRAFCQCWPRAPCHSLLWWGCQPSWGCWQIAEEKDRWGEGEPLTEGSTHSTWGPEGLPVLRCLYFPGCFSLVPSSPVGQAHTLTSLLYRSRIINCSEEAFIYHITQEQKK